MDDTVSGNQNLTFDDVKKAVGDIDPHATNMSRLRKHLGRGSFGTIQKHLSTLRNQSIKSRQPEAVPVPAAPPELLSMWGAAVAVAVSQVRTRLDDVVQARDTLTQELQSARGDVLAFTEELESAGERAEVAEKAVVEVQAAHLADLEKAKVDQVEAAADRELLAQEIERSKALLAQEIERGKADLVKAQADAAHAAQLAESSRVLMREELARLTDQIGELKAHLYKRAEAAPAPVAPKG